MLRNIPVRISALDFLSYSPLMPKHCAIELSYLWGDVQSRIPTGRFWCLEHSFKKRKCAQVIHIKKKLELYGAECKHAN